MIGRVVVQLAGLCVGAVVGAILVLAMLPAPAIEDRPDPTPPADAPEVKAAPLPVTSAGMLLAWTPGGLPDGFADAAAASEGVTHTAIVAAGGVDLVATHDPSGTAIEQLAAGWSIPLDAIAVDPTTFAEVGPARERPSFELLTPGTVLLGATSATLREADVGAELSLAPDWSYTVVGIVDDAAIGAAEVVLHRDDPAAAELAPRYLLLRHDGDRGLVEQALQRAAGDRPVRVRSPGETPFLRHGDAVLPQSLVKARYGEFAYRRPDANSLVFEPDPDWVAQHLETRQLPLLGTVTCHRAAFASLERALTELERQGAAHTLDPDGFEGCWNPRSISPGGDLSRHAWGIAIDVNADGNPTGTSSAQPTELVDVLTAHGWGWGGTWLVPDPMHFELVDSHAPAAVKVWP